MSGPYFQSLDPASPPGPITPQAAPSDPAGYAAVYPHGPGPAPYDIQAPMPDVAGPFAGAVAVAGAGVLYPMGPRQRATEQLLSSPQGWGAFDITEGFSGEPDEAWPNSTEPPMAPVETPDQGTGDYAGTGTD
jgi:hypothetical protein